MIYIQLCTSMLERALLAHFSIFSPTKRMRTSTGDRSDPAPVTRPPLHVESRKIFDFTDLLFRFSHFNIRI